MDPPDRTVDSGGGAVFQGDITAGRDITINQITEIRQVTERLSSRCSGADNKLRADLQDLSGAAEFTDNFARELNASVYASDPFLERVSRECASILGELKQLEQSLEQDKNGTNVSTASLSETVGEIRSRLISLQTHLNNVSNRKIAKDYEAIKEAITELMKDHQSSDDVSSIRSFFTAPEIPYVEQQIWQEIVKTLQARFSTDYVRENDALIKSTLEDIVFDNTAPWIVEEPEPRVSTSRLTTPTLRLSETYNIATTETEGEDRLKDGASLRSRSSGEPFTETERDQERDGGASSRSFFSSEAPSTKIKRQNPRMRQRSLHITQRDIVWSNKPPNPVFEDKSGAEWSRSVEGGTGECLLALGLYARWHA